MPFIRPEEKLVFGPFELNLSAWELRRKGVRIRVQQQPLRILALLLKRPGELITRQEIRACIWPKDLYLDYEHGLNRSINKLRRALLDSAQEPRYIETLPARGYRFVGEVRPCTANDVASFRPAGTCTDSPRRPSPSLHIPVPCRGALPLNSQFYVERDVDSRVHRAIDGEDSVVLLKGARLTGKTSLLARALAKSRNAGRRSVITDMQKIEAEKLADISSFLRALASLLTETLELDMETETIWDPRRSVSSNFERFLRRVLNVQGSRLVWGIDEADRVFPQPYASEFFGLLRAWHNERALDPDSHWQRLTIAIAYATEAHLFIADPNLSPFNVGSKFELQDFTQDQIAALGTRYGFSAHELDIKQLQILFGGHPYLIQRALYEVATRNYSMNGLASSAANEDGPFAEHLRHLLLTMERRPELVDAIRNILKGSGKLTTEQFYRLRAFGILVGDSAKEPALRCDLYRQYLSRHLI